MQEKYCEHCWPTERRYHLRPHLNYFLGVLRQKTPNLRISYLSKPTSRLWLLFLKLLSFFKIVKFESKPNPSQLRNRSLIFWKEARRRDIEVEQIKVLDKPTNFFRLNQNKFYEAIPLTVEQNQINFDDKFKVKRILEEKEIPVPKGRCFLSSKKALSYAEKLSYPLVVKPRFGSLSEHANWNIPNEKQLKQAIKIAKQYQPGFILEEYLKGSLFRATVIKDRVFVCKKEKANVVGDGESTIKELINEKNNDTQRGSTHQKNTTLHEIPVNNRLLKNLKQQGLTLKSVPDKDQKVYLHRKIILSQGCDIIERTEQTHPKNKELFKKTAQTLETDLVGFDFITPDITVPYFKQKTGIIEANSLPYADMHQFPSKGKSQPVAKTAWDKVEK